MTVKPTAFSLHIPDADIADLRERLARTRLPDQAPGEPWAYGTDVAYLRGLIEYWGKEFDWRVAEAALNAFPQFRVPLHDIDLHYLHVPGVGPDPMPLLCCMAGRVRCSSFSTSCRASPIPRASAAMRAMPLPWWRRHCPAMACRFGRAKSGSAFPKWRIVSQR
jgi:hypothetical protein